MLAIIYLYKKPLVNLYESHVTFLKAYTPQFAFWSLANIQYYTSCKMYILLKHVYLCKRRGLRTETPWIRGVVQDLKLWTALKGRVSDFWKPMLIFEIKSPKQTHLYTTKGSRPYFDRSAPHIRSLRNPGKWLVLWNINHFSTEITYNNMYQELFPPDRLLSAFPSRSKVPRRLGK